MSRKFAVVILLAALTPPLLGQFQQYYEKECPEEWVENRARQICYRFEYAHQMSFKNALLACKDYAPSAQLLAISDDEEHVWIQQQLTANWQQHPNDWLTGGHRKGPPYVDDSYTFEWMSEDPYRQVEAPDDYWIYKNRHDLINPLRLPNDPYNVMAYSRHPEHGYWAWSLLRDDSVRPFICELERQFVPELFAPRPSIGFGQANVDPRKIERAPRIIKQPTSVVYFRNSDARLKLETVADGWPLPSYKWYRVTEQLGNVSYVNEVKPGKEYGISQFNGLLVFHDKQSSKEPEIASKYVCLAANKYGTVMSSIVQITFTELTPFSKTPRAPLQTSIYAPIVIACNAPPLDPPPLYTWYRDNPGEIISPQFPGKEHIFPSADGSLYFQQVLDTDAGNYKCQIEPHGDTVVSDKIAQVSQPIQVIVLKSSALREPRIFETFPKVASKLPLVGKDIRVECVSEGSYSPLYYSWERHLVLEGREFPVPMPKNVHFEDQNRVLVIRNATMSDGGRYICTVKADKTSSNSRSVDLEIYAAPFFAFPMRDIVTHERDSDTILRCLAEGKPSVHVNWYRNGEPMYPGALQPLDEGRFKWTNNMREMHILQLDKTRDAGVYSCVASNVYGVSSDEAEFRVDNIAPTFVREPVQLNNLATVNNPFIIRCRPEGSGIGTPALRYTWKRNGNTIGMSQSVRILEPFGDLYMSRVNWNDEGYYSCVAKNDYGTAESSGWLRVLEATVIMIYPPLRSPPVRVNETLILPCEANSSMRLDLQYEWWLNNRFVDFVREHRYKLGYIPPEILAVNHTLRHTYVGPGYLVIPSVQHDDHGNWTCVARSSTDLSSRHTMLYVWGPPSMPAGVRGKILGPAEIELQWLVPEANGFEITGYIVKSMIEYEKNWTTQVEMNVNRSDPDSYFYRQLCPPGNRFCRVVLSNLTAYSKYKFHVQAVNEMGVSLPSPDSSWYETPSDIPFINPIIINACSDFPWDIVNSTIPDAISYVYQAHEHHMSKNSLQSFQPACGGGKVGTLQVLWEPLPRKLWNGPGVFYNLQFRRANTGDDWSRPITIEGAEKGKYVTIVGQSKNFYLDYEIRIWAGNSKGVCTIEPLSYIIKSAEDIPPGAPRITYAQPFNESALQVWWTPIPDTRADVKGKLLGYKILYWMSEKEIELDAMRIWHYGQNDTGLVSGLRAETYYTFRVQVWNGAGQSRPSDFYSVETLRRAPIEAPRWVKLWPVNGNSVRVTWRGVQTGILEEPIEGYRILCWLVGESIINAFPGYDAGRTVDFTIPNLLNSTRYQLRVYGYSRGGIGKMSSPVIIFELDSTYLKVYRGMDAGSTLITPTHSLLIWAYISVCFILGYQQQH